MKNNVSSRLSAEGKTLQFICQSVILLSFISAWFDTDFLSRQTAERLDAIVISTK